MKTQMIQHGEMDELMDMEVNSRFPEPEEDDDNDDLIFEEEDDFDLDDLGDLDNFDDFDDDDF